MVQKFAAKLYFGRVICHLVQVIGCLDGSKLTCIVQYITLESLFLIMLQ